MKQITYKHGAFTNTEDVHIIRRYLEWKCVYKENAKSGIWSLLERELNRKDKRISELWRHVLCKRLATLVPLDAENNIIDPLKALVMWIEHQDEMVRLNVVSNHNGYVAYDNLGASTASSKALGSTNNRSAASVLKKRAYSTTDSVQSVNSNDTNGTARKSFVERPANTLPKVDTNSTNDSTMNDINDILQSINNEEYTNHSILSLSSSVYDGTTYGGSMWSTIDNNNNNITDNNSISQTPTGVYNSYNNTNNTKQYTDSFMNDNNAFSSSVWNSLTSPSTSKGTKSMSRWTEEQVCLFLADIVFNIIYFLFGR